jgi:hypothetical protein
VFTNVISNSSAGNDVGATTLASGYLKGKGRSKFKSAMLGEIFYYRSEQTFFQTWRLGLRAESP